MNIREYTDYFHDGSILSVTHTRVDMEITMESAEMFPEDIVDDAVLSDDGRLRGKLSLYGVKQVSVNDAKIDKLELLHEGAEICDFDIDGTFIIFQLEWVDSSAKNRSYEFSVIEILADEVEWENLPDLEV